MTNIEVMNNKEMKSELSQVILNIMNVRVQVRSFELRTLNFKPYTLNLSLNIMNAKMLISGFGLNTLNFKPYTLNLIP